MQMPKKTKTKLFLKYGTKQYQITLGFTQLTKPINYFLMKTNHCMS